jgi:hypothetical protein
VRARQHSTFTGPPRPIWACEKDDVRGTDHTRCKSSRSHVRRAMRCSRSNVFTRARQGPRRPVPGEFGVLLRRSTYRRHHRPFAGRTWSCTSGRPAGSARSRTRFSQRHQSTFCSLRISRYVRVRLPCGASSRRSTRLWATPPSACRTPSTSGGQQLTTRGTCILITSSRKAKRCCCRMHG